MLNASIPVRPYLFAVPRRPTIAARGVLPFAASPWFGVATAGAVEPDALHPHRRVAVSVSWKRSVLALLGGWRVFCYAFVIRWPGRQSTSGRCLANTAFQGRCATKPRSAPELRRYRESPSLK